MVIKKLLFAGCLFFHTSVFGQDITLSPSPVEDVNFDYMKIMGQDEEGFFLLQSNLPLDLDRDKIGFKSRKYRISYFTFNLIPLWSKTVDVIQPGGTVETISMLNSDVLVLSSQENKNNKTISVYGRIINAKGSDIKVQHIADFSLQTFSHNKPQCIVSANRQLAAFHFIEFNSDKLQTDHLCIMDSSLTPVIQKTISIPYGEKNFYPVDFALSNNGDFNFMGVRSLKANESGKKRKEDFILFVSPASDNRSFELGIGESEIQLTGAALAFDNAKNRVVCAGFCFDKSANTGAGIIYGYAEMNNNPAFRFFRSSVDNKFQLKLIGERNSGNEIGLVEYPVKKIILRNDGGAVMIAEALYTNEYSYYDYFTQSFTRRTDYHFNNVVAVSINNDGSIDWLNMIRKDQESTDDGGIFSSFCLMTRDESIALIYNSTISRENEIFAARINTTGKEQQLTKLKQPSQVLLYSTGGKQVAEDEVIIPCISRKKTYLAKIIF